MFRKSGLLAIAFGLAAMGTATVPAAAFPNSGQPSFGLKPNHPPIMMPQGQPSVGLKGPVIGLGLPKNPVSQPAPAAPSQGSPVAKMPIDLCVITHKCPPHDHDHDHYHGPIVILTPPVQVGIPVPVGIPGRVSTGTAIPSLPRPVMAQPSQNQGCSQAATIPQLGTGIDQLLPNASLSDADLAKITSMRQTIQELSADGKEAAARDTEEVAMNLLGYRKVWQSCGIGFDWVRQDTSADAGQPK